MKWLIKVSTQNHTHKNFRMWKNMLSEEVTKERSIVKGCLLLCLQHDRSTCLSKVSKVNWIGIFQISLKLSFTLWLKQMEGSFLKTSFSFGDIIYLLLLLSWLLLSDIINVTYLLTLPLNYFLSFALMHKQHFYTVTVSKI